MTQTTVIERLKKVLTGFSIKRDWLFGSYFTGGATEDSDIDLLVDYDKTEDFSLFTIGLVVSNSTKYGYFPGGVC